MTIVEATRRYEAWLGREIPIIRADLEVIAASDGVSSGGFTAGVSSSRGRPQSVQRHGSHRAAISVMIQHGPKKPACQWSMPGATHAAADGDAIHCPSRNLCTLRVGSDFEHAPSFPR